MAASKPPITHPKTLQGDLRRVMMHPATDHIVSVLILASVLLLLVEAIHPNDARVHAAGLIIMLLFLLEMILRFLAAASKWAFLRSYWVDLLSLLPLIFPNLGLLRALRLLRLFRLGVLMRQSSRLFGGAIRMTGAEQMTIFTVIVVVVMSVTLVLVEVEPGFKNVYDTFWWSLLSLVAGEPMGEMPQTFIGKVFTLVIMVGGLTVFALFTGTVSAVMADRLTKGWRHGLMNPEDLENHIVVCGWNRSGGVLLEEIQAHLDMKNRPIAVVAESRPEFSDEIEANPRIIFVEGDYTRVDVLKRARVEVASSAILLADRTNPNRSDQDRDARTILAALMIEKLHPGIFTCAELLSRNNEVHLRMAGIEEVVIGDEYSATILATSARVRGVTQIVDEVFSNKYGNQIYKRAIRPEWKGMSFLDLQSKVKSEHDALLIAVERRSAPASPEGDDAPYARTITNPPADYKFQEGDRLIVISESEPAW